MENVQQDRRRWPRMAASSLGDMSASIVAGPPATLVNVSRGGALLEVASRIPLKGSVRLKLTPVTGERIDAEGSLAWAKVARIAGGRVTYWIAVEFTRPIQALAPSAVDAGEEKAEEEKALQGSRPEPSRGSAIETRAHDLGRKLAAATADLACQTALVECLAAKLKTFDRFRDASSAEWARERRQWADERASLVQQVADAIARAEALQARLDARQRDREHYEAELERCRANAETARVDAAVRHRALETRLQAAEARCAVHDRRSRAVRREAETLVAKVAAPLRTGSRPGDGGQSTPEQEEQPIAAVSHPDWQNECAR